MDSRQLFERVKALWPDAIILTVDSERRPFDPIWSISQVYEAIETRIESDEWLSLGAWAFHQVLTALARSKIATGETTVRPSAITFEAFDFSMRANLEDDSWADVRRDYDSNNS